MPEFDTERLDYEPAGKSANVGAAPEGAAETLSNGDRKRNSDREIGSESVW